MDANFVLLAMVLAGAGVVSIPLIGWTIRFAIKPAVDSIAAAISASRAAGPSHDLRDRLDQLEVQLTEVQQSLSHLSETRAFDRELSRSSPPLLERKE
jgi:hypothetical protein